MPKIDYDSFADLYDLYASTDYDFDFFTKEIKQSGTPVLELTSGTGRLSIPLIEAGADLTCVDISQGMLDVLRKKLDKNNYSANVICSDITDIELHAKFELAILPFQSFMELIGRKKQTKALAAIYQALKPNGRFICTMHNPSIRRKSVDGSLRLVGNFSLNGGTLVVSGIEQGGFPVVARSQFYEYYDESGVLEWKRLLNMQFEFIERTDFEAMAKQQGFTIASLYGDYDRSVFDSANSPVMIWELEKNQTY